MTASAGSGRSPYTEAHHRLRYRPEVDGLRALAVLPVILFHTGFELFGGGFVGVDVFFVISGYLITTIVVADLAKGSFSLMRFYERRVRRILPALCLVVSICLPMAWLWLDPVDMMEFCRSLVALPLMGTNVVFWREGGYFSSTSEFKPLLHTWSLAVEEQFYLVYPWLLMAVWRLGRNRLAMILATLGIASIGVAQWGALYKPDATFLLMPTRAWELAVGCLIALRMSGPGSRPTPAWLAGPACALGLAAVVIPVFWFDRGTLHPALPTLLPVLGAALLLMYAGPGNFVGKALSRRPVVALGLISYSAYLWHQPLFAFYRIRTLTEPSAVTALSLAAVSVMLAYFTWRHVELPFRSPERVGGRPMFAVLGSAMLVFLAFGTAGLTSGGFDGRFDMPDSLARSFDITARSSTCLDIRDIRHAQSWLCPVGDAQAPLEFMVFGDSHANSLFEAIDDAARLEGVHGVFTAQSGCTPLLGVHALRGWSHGPNCFDLNERVFQHVKAARFKRIYLIAKWTYYTDGGYRHERLSPIGLDPGDPMDMTTSRRAFVQGLRSTAERYAALGVEVVILTQVPQQHLGPRRVVYRAIAEGRSVAAEMRARSVTVNEHRTLQAFVTETFAKTPNLTVLRLDEILCDAQVCPSGDDQGGFYLDETHYSLYGARHLIDWLRRALQPRP